MNINNSNYFLLIEFANFFHVLLTFYFIKGGVCISACINFRSGMRGMETF